jgi:zinc protease
MARGWLAAAGLIAATAAPAGEEVRVFPYATHVRTLDNGLRVILVPMGSPGLVAYWSIVRTGSRDEIEPGRTGFAHFFEHMMFRGTERFPEHVYNATVTRLGADANAYTSDDLTAYHLAFAAEDLETVVELESDRFLNLAYAEPEFRTEAGAVYGEYRKSRTDPFFALHEALRGTAFERHPYGHTTMGFEQDIARMPSLYDYSRSFFSRFYRPDNVVLVIVGDLDVERTFTLIRRSYGAWEPGYRAPVVEREPEQTAERRIEVPYAGRTLPVVWLAFKIDRFDPANRLYVAARLLAELAFGETSAIHKKLVLEEQLAEFVAADVEINRDPGTFDVFARVKDPARVGEVLAEIERAIADCREHAPAPRQLDELKSRLRYEFLMRLDTPDRVAGALARIVGVTGGVDDVDRLYAAYTAVEPADVQAAARLYLSPVRRTVAVLRAETP